MPRTYIKKRSGPDYLLADVAAAVHDVENQSATRSMVEIFSNVIKKCNKVESNANTSTSVKGTPRLKCSTYGEVLTTTEVLERLKEAQTNKEKKSKTNPKRCTKEQKLKKTPTEKKSNDLDIISSEEETEEEIRNAIEIESSEEVIYEVPKPGDVIPGSYVLVDFLGGARNKTHYTYLCVVNSCLPSQEYVVTGMKSQNNIKTTFCMVENDISTISYSMIKPMLPSPSVESRDRKLFYVFPGSVEVKEKQ